MTTACLSKHAVRRATLHALVLGLLLASTVGSGRASIGSDDVAAEIEQRAAYYGASAGQMLRVARCESRLDPLAVNRGSGATGVFQWHPRGLWYATPHAQQVNIFELYRAGDPDAVYWDLDAAAWAFSRGLQGHWVCK